MLNKGLVKERGLSDFKIYALEQQHERLRDCLENPEKYGTNKDVVLLIREIEYTLQELWGFPKDINYHTYWGRVKGCNCPSSDNQIGSPYKWVRTTCPFHGNME